MTASAEKERAELEACLEEPMKEKHTQGPWEPVTDRQYSDLPYLVVGAGASDAKSVEWMPLYVQVGGRTGWVEQKANTLLIAAAPELLAALKKVAKSLEWHAHGCCRGIDDEGPLPTKEAVELAKRTIAKALGHASY